MPDFQFGSWSWRQFGRDAGGGRITRLARAAALAAALGVAPLAAPAATIEVDLELVLLTDVSVSVSNDEFNLMRQGYAAAFRSAGVIGAIAKGALGKIAVHVIQYSANPQAALGGAWTVIDSAATANAFADALDAMTRLSNTTTGTTKGVIAATTAFEANSITSSRQVIDVATDGVDNVACLFTATVTCAPLQDARDAAIKAGVDQINALVIPDAFYSGTVLEAYAKGNIIAGEDSFVKQVADFNAFKDGMTAKLVQEITPPAPIPLPAAGVLLLAGLAGLGIAARRKRAAA